VASENPDGSAHTLAERLASVKRQIDDAAKDAGRDPGAITTVVVTKFHPPQLVRELFALGVRDFGESRHQEAAPKVAELGDLDATWHFIGQLQSKKARQVRDYISVIHSVDRESLVDALIGDDNRDVFLQVNLTTDPDRGGVAPDRLDALVERAVGTAGITVRGLMAVAPVDEEPRSAFARVREFSERIQRSFPSVTALSIGMSGDFREAIMEGATHLRIGSAITGNRPTLG
jgi:pyridoxal phosphate enzyme (YggS family)